MKSNRYLRKNNKNFDYPTIFLYFCIVKLVIRIIIVLL